MANKLIPKVRFVGFTDEWDQFRFEDIIEFFNEFRIPIDSGKREKGEIPYYGATGVIDYVKDYIFDGEYVLLAEDGANIITRNYPVAYLTKGKFWLNNHAHILRMRQGSNQFLLQILENKSYEKYNSGTAQPKLNTQVVKKIVSYFPEIQEQQKIGNFFKQLDETITLQERKLALLKEQKKGFLQKMFPKEGEKVPEIRFDGFTDDWECYKLGEKLDLLKDGTHGTHKDVDEGPYLLSAKNIKNGKINITSTERRITEKEFKKIHSNFSLKENDILLTVVGSIGEAAIMNSSKNITFQRSVAYLRSSSINSLFLYSFIVSGYFQRELKNRQVVSAQPGVYLGELHKIKVKFPREKEEQTKIGNFFKQLDDTITLEQRKLDSLKELKKAYLQKMFV